MASIVLSGVKLALTGMGTAKVLGEIGGAIFSDMLNNTIFAAPPSQSFGSKLDRINLQTIHYGKMIPIVYGTIRLAGNIIWATKLTEREDVQHEMTGGKFSRIKHSHTDYCYTISLAIALCEGVITSVTRIWANDIELNISAYKIRIYNGSEEQNPDPLIESVQGIGNTTAYRGLAYVVIEDLPLKEFGNKLPNFLFEVHRKIFNDMNALEDMIDSVVMIPGSGEMVYDTTIQSKYAGFHDISQIWVGTGTPSQINCHTHYNVADSIVSLNQMQQILPQIKWVAPVVGWFANNIDIELAQIMPGVEFQGVEEIMPHEWNVGKYQRCNAHLISKTNNQINYGGSPSDHSVKSYLQELRARNLKIMLLPFIFMDIEGKPWRGRLTGQAKDIRNFFRKKDGYNEFILHYAELTKGLVDTFIIGSELVGLTSIQHGNSFPAVDELINLAEQVKAILGSDVKISYAADWSEYHHTVGGYYNLDKLWANDAIDFIGIDCYFPLTESNIVGMKSVDEIRSGWDRGELYDYYVDAQGESQPISPEWALKNIEYWWSNDHYNPDHTKTEWIPKSKKIWFTELGFPSVSGSSNQPNVFLDNSSTESKLPNGSSGSIDFQIQRKALLATLERWRNSDIVEKKFIWAWDARPYPYWPALHSVWSDSANWARGHWIQGKLGLVTVSKIIREMSIRAGIESININLVNLEKQLDLSIHGMIISQQQSIKKCIEYLQHIYDFMMFEKNSKLDFTSKNRIMKKSILIEDMIALEAEEGFEALNIVRNKIQEIPSRICINYIDRFSEYAIKSHYVQRNDYYGRKSLDIDIPVVLPENEALSIASRLLFAAWNYRNAYSFALKFEYLDLNIGDLITIQSEYQDHIIRITEIDIGRNNCLYCKGVEESFYVESIQNHMNFSDKCSAVVSKTKFEILDIPLMEDEKFLRVPRVLIACCGDGENWAGCTIYYQKQGGVLTELISITNAATMGEALLSNERHHHHLVDKKSVLEIGLTHGILYSIQDIDFYNYKNLACIGNEIIQFKDVQLKESHRYTVSTLQRNLYNTGDVKKEKSQSKSNFVLLDNNVVAVALPFECINQDLIFYAVTHGHTIANQSSQHIFFQARNLQPLKPVHLKMSKNHQKFSWRRQIRGYSALDNFMVAPINEDKELYALTIMFKNGIKKDVVVQENNQIELHDDNIQSFCVRQISSTIGYGAQACVEYL